MNNPKNQRYDVLLVEDDPTDVLLTKRAFKKAAIEVNLSIATDGIAALETLQAAERSRLPSLVIMDINMPRKDGKEVLAEIKSDPTIRHIPVVMLTTSDAEKDIRESYERMASGYFVKPANSSGFQETVATIRDYWFKTASLPT